MQKLKVYQHVLLMVIISLTICFAFSYAYDYFKQNKIENTQGKLDEIRKEKQKEIDKKQKEIDSILVDLEKNYQKIIILTGKVDAIKNDNKNLEKELEKRKSEIIKMSNDEIVKYWKNEFEK
jgi:peptidoglycan hydrolase CwlO-like protein